MGSPSVTLYCEHVVFESAIHCSKYTSLQVDLDETPREAIEESHWAVVDGEVRCEEHH